MLCLPVCLPAAPAGRPDDTTTPTDTTPADDTSKDTTEGGEDATDETVGSPDGTIVIAETGFEGKFSPFFAASAPDQAAHVLTQAVLLNTDRRGEIIMHGIEGETRSYNGTDLRIMVWLTVRSPRTTTAPSPMPSRCVTTSPSPTARR